MPIARPSCGLPDAKFPAGSGCPIDVARQAAGSLHSLRFSQLHREGGLATSLAGSGYKRRRSPRDINKLQDRLDSGRDRSVRWRVQPEFEPAYENHVALSATKKDPFGLPLPELTLNYTERDQRTIERCRRFHAETKKALEGIEDRDFEFYRAHPAGTCRMGFDETNGVVDANNKVFGVSNLYVSGACTFTTSGTSNPTGPVVALTLRLADHLIELHKADRA